MAGGSHRVLFWSYPNCQESPASPLALTLAPGEVRSVSFAVTCVAYYGTVRAIVNAVGTNIDPTYRVTQCDLFDCWDARDVAAGGSVSFLVDRTSYRYTLEDVAPNCTIVGPSSVDVSAGVRETVQVSFDVRCQ